MNAKLEALVDLGYEVTPAATAGKKLPAVYFVNGFGVCTYVTEDDDTAVQSVADEHDERLKQADETPEQTQERWALEQTDAST